MSLFIEPAEAVVVAVISDERHIVEIDKLILYCAGRTAITADDILAIVGDATEAGLEAERAAREAALLDVEDPISGHYNLEVSSPGLDRPLFTAEHFRRFTGEMAQLTVYAPVDGRRRFKGEILACEDDRVRVLQDGAEIELIGGEQWGAVSLTRAQDRALLALYGDRGLWVRPLAMFLETVAVDGETRPRFEYLGPG